MNGSCSLRAHRGSPLSGQSTGGPAGERGEEPRGDIRAGRFAGPPGCALGRREGGGRRVRGRRIVFERRVGAIDALALRTSSIPLWSLP